jgi:hypothetical protein
MRRVFLGVSALALVATLATGCTDADTPRTSERPGERVPSASPPTTVPPPATSPTPSAPSSSTDTTTSPSGSTSTTPGATGSSTR